MKTFFKILAAVISLNVIFLAQNLFAQDSPGFEDETSESIMQREQFIYERRAGGPGMVVPPNAYQDALRQMMLIPKDRNSGSMTSLVAWVSVNPQGMFYNRTGANYISGRTNSIAVHPSNFNVMYIGA